SIQQVAVIQAVCELRPDIHTPAAPLINKAEGPPWGPLRGRCVHQGTKHTAAIWSGSCLHYCTH
ncbi:Hypothetical predicted protein, partial [Scomber scombrus]